MASAIGLHKAELIKPRGPWRRLADVELAAAEYIGRFNSRVSSADPLDRSMGISAEPFKVGRAGEPTLWRTDAERHAGKRQARPRSGCARSL